MFRATWRKHASAESYAGEGRELVDHFEQERICEMELRQPYDHCAMYSTRISSKAHRQGKEATSSFALLFSLLAWFAV